jgi:hypothetical protein
LVSRSVGPDEVHSAGFRLFPFHHPGTLLKPHSDILVFVFGFLYEQIISDFPRSVNKESALFFTFVSENVRQFENSFTKCRIYRL